LILLVGQVGRELQGREAFQEIDLATMFGLAARGVEDPRRLPPVEHSPRQPLEGHELEDRHEARPRVLHERQERLGLVVEDVVGRGNRPLDAEVQLRIKAETIVAHAEGAEDGPEQDQEEVLLQEL